MVPWSPIAVSLRSPSDVGRARRGLRRLAHELGVDEEVGERCVQVASELSTNVLRHAGRGSLCAFPERRGIAVVVSDRGKGIADVADALRDGASSGRGLGLGLGAVQRASDVFEITTSEAGTQVLAVIGGAPAWFQRGRWQVGCAIVPASGEHDCGDSFWFAPRDDDSLDLLVIDGLGHGPLAHAAARQAVEAKWDPGEDPAAVLQRIHTSIARSRGAAVMALRLRADPDGLSLQFAGVGNVIAKLIEPGGGKGFTLLSQPGIVGRNLPRVRAETRRCSARARLFVCTDGVASEWQRSQPAARGVRAGALHAAAVVHAHSRGRDDATCVRVERVDGSALRG